MSRSPRTDDPRVAILGQLLPGSAGGIETNLLKLLVSLAADNGDTGRQLVIGPGGKSAWLLPHLGHGQKMIEWPPFRCELPRAGRSDVAAGFTRVLRDVVWKMLGRGTVSAFSNSARRLTRKLKRAGVEVVHFPYQRYFPTSLPFIFEPWDLQHIHLPEMFSAEEIKLRDWLYRRACEEAALVVTATRWSKHDLMQHFGLPSSKIAVIPRGAELQAAEREPLAIDEVLRRLRLPQQFALYPAKTWPHKNHTRLFQALASLRNEAGLTIPLVCTGKPLGADIDRIQRELESLGLRDQVRFTGFVDEETMRTLFEQAQLVVFPSLFEGLGIPVLEAMASGTPVVCSQASCLSEIGGDAAVFFDPYSVADIAAKTAMVWRDRTLRAEMQQRGYSNAASFSWADAARSFRVVYRHVAKRPLNSAETRRLEYMLS